MRGAPWWLQLAASGGISARQGGRAQRSLADSELRRGAESAEARPLDLQVQGAREKRAEQREGDQRHAAGPFEY